MRRSRPSKIKNCPYVSKGGLKLEFALQHFSCNVENQVAIDFGSHQGGFVDCLLQNGAEKVYSVDTCYGTLAWKIRQNDKVVVYERTNAMHWKSPEPASTISIDVAWTKQQYIIPNAMENMCDTGQILSLLKPQYEKNYQKSQKGILEESQVQNIIEETQSYLQQHFSQVEYVLSPYKGSGGNTEIWFYLKGPIRET